MKRTILGIPVVINTGAPKEHIEMHPEMWTQLVDQVMKSGVETLVVRVEADREQAW